MNHLSWLLYLAELSDSMSSFLWMIFFIVVGTTITFYVFYRQDVSDRDVLIKADNDGYYRDQSEGSFKARKELLETKLKALSKPRLWPATAFAVLALVLGFIATALPSKGTVYAIAASEMGEQFLKTNVANKAQQALEVWLDKQIRDATKSATTGA